MFLEGMEGRHMLSVTLMEEITDEGIIQIAKSALKKDVCPRFALLQYMTIKDMANIDLQQTGRPCNGRGDMCPALMCCSQARICLYASAYTSFSQQTKRNRRERGRKRESYAVIRRNMIFHAALILQFNLKFFIMLKKSSQVYK